MKNIYTFEEFVNESLHEGTTPHYKRLIQRAKEEGISTDSELYDLISDEFDDEQITGADYEEARKVLKITESVVNEARTKDELLTTLGLLEDKLKKWNGVRQNSIHPFDPQKKVSDYVAYLKQSIGYITSELAELKESVEINEAKKEKFLLYTNPGNATDRAYVAIGADDVREVLSDSKKYRDSYQILHQGTGTQDDLIKAKRMFSNYRFGDETIGESIDESINEADMTREYDGFIILDYKTKKQYKGRYIKGLKSTKSEDIAIASATKMTGSERFTFAVHGFIKKGEWNESELPELKA